MMPIDDGRSPFPDLAGYLASSQMFSGHVLEHVSKTTSTNDDLKAFWSKQPKAQRILIADHQTAGRGQYGRKWSSLAGHSLLFSFSLIDFQRQIPLPLFAGLALYQAICQVAGSADKTLWLKWPNDLWLQRRKLAGVLCESCQANGHRHFVVGIGVNLEPLPEEIFPAACLAEICDQPDRDKLLCAFFAAFSRLMALDDDFVVNAWTNSAKAFWQTRFVVNDGSLESFVGVPISLEKDGALIIMSEATKKSRRLLSATLKPLF
jgi:biotin-[acetyl-CoA-carboxylase] ligase BirA-like protein